MTKKPNLVIIENLRAFLLLSEIPLIYKEKPTSFTRNRKLPFPRLVTFMLKALRKKISLEVTHFYEKLVSMALEEEQASLTASCLLSKSSKVKAFIFQRWASSFYP